MCVGILEEFFFYRIRWEVVVVFDDHRLIALSDNLSVPCRSFSHDSRSSGEKSFDTDWCRYEGGVIISSVDDASVYTRVVRLTRRGFAEVHKPLLYSIDRCPSGVEESDLKSGRNLSVISSIFDLVVSFPTMTERILINHRRFTIQRTANVFLSYICSIFINVDSAEKFMLYGKISCKCENLTENSVSNQKRACCPVMGGRRGGGWRTETEKERSLIQIDIRLDVVFLTCWSGPSMLLLLLSFVHSSALKNERTLIGQVRKDDRLEYTYIHRICGAIETRQSFSFISGSECSFQRSSNQPDV